MCMRWMMNVYTIDYGYVCDISCVVCDDIYRIIPFYS